tara:strand:+ start:1122 stop:1433 length:312 start_codon:yes stop_codon:yes gene_type:complete
MAGSSKQKKAMAATMAMYFAEKGYIQDPREFTKDPDRPVAIKISTVKKIFGSWSIMEKFTKSFCPDLMKGLTNVKPVEADPLEELKKAQTAEAEKEGANGESI